MLSRCHPVKWSVFLFWCIWARQTREMYRWNFRMPSRPTKLRTRGMRKTEIQLNANLGFYTNERSEKNEIRSEISHLWWWWCSSSTWWWRKSGSESVLENFKVNVDWETPNNKKCYWNISKYTSKSSLSIPFVAIQHWEFTVIINGHVLLTGICARRILKNTLISKKFRSKTLVKSKSNISKPPNWSPLIYLFQYPLNFPIYCFAPRWGFSENVSL